MADALKKVQPGGPLVIPAATYNTFVDSARDFLDRRHGRGQDPQPAARDSGIVLVRNDSGSDRERFDVLAINGPVIGPDANEEEFKNRPALAGGTPGSGDDGRFVILLEPLADGAMGRACVSGLCPARVHFDEEADGADYRFAEIEPGECGYLTAAAGGSAQVLWREGGAGRQWALVRPGPDAPAPQGVIGLTSLSVRYHITGNGSTLVDPRDWRGGAFWHSLQWLNAEGPGAADQYPGPWESLWDAPRPFYISVDCFFGGQGPFTVFQESLGGGTTVKLYLDKDDGGGLRMDFSGYGGYMQHVILTIVGFARLPAEESVEVP